MGEDMADISNTASLSLSGILPGGSQVDSLISLAKSSGGDAVQSLDFGGVSLNSDRIAVASGASFSTQISALRQAAANAAQGSSALDVADSALTDISDKLSRLAELADTAARTPIERSDGSTYTPAELSGGDRAILQAEFADVRSQIDQVAGAASFDGTSLLSGDPSSPSDPLQLSYEVGVGSSNKVTVSLNPADTASLSSDLASTSLMTAGGSDVAVTAVSDAQDALGVIQAAGRGARTQFSDVSDARDQVGAVVDRARDVKTDPQVAVDMSRLVAKKAEDQGGVALVKGAAQLLQAVLLRDAAVSTPNGAPASGSAAIEEFGGKTAGAPALPTTTSSSWSGSSSDSQP